MSFHSITKENLLDSSRSQMTSYNNDLKVNQLHHSTVTLTIPSLDSYGASAKIANGSAANDVNNSKSPFVSLFINLFM